MKQNEFTWLTSVWKAFHLYLLLSTRQLGTGREDKHPCLLSRISQPWPRGIAYRHERCSTKHLLYLCHFYNCLLGQIYSLQFLMKMTFQVRTGLRPICLIKPTGQASVRRCYNNIGWLIWNSNNVELHNLMFCNSTPTVMRFKNLNM